MPVKKLIFLFFLTLVVAVIAFKREDIFFGFFPKTLVSPLGTGLREEEFEKKLYQLGLSPQSLVFQEGAVKAQFLNQPTVLFSLEKDLSDQVASLQFILSRAKIEGKMPSLIDLRFEKPVLKY